MQFIADNWMFWIGWTAVSAALASANHVALMMAMGKPGTPRPRSFYLRIAVSATLSAAIFAGLVLVALATVINLIQHFR